MYSNWQDFNRRGASRGPSAIAELLVILFSAHLRSVWDVRVGPQCDDDAVWRALLLQRHHQQAAAAAAAAAAARLHGLFSCQAPPPLPQCCHQPRRRFNALLDNPPASVSHTLIVIIYSFI